MPIISVGFYIQIYIENSKYNRTGRNILEYFCNAASPGDKTQNIRNITF